LTNCAISPFEIRPSWLRSNSAKNRLNIDKVACGFPYWTRMSLRNLRVSRLFKYPLLSLSYSYQIWLTILLTSKFEESYSWSKNCLTKLVISFLERTPSWLTSYLLKNLLNIEIEAGYCPLLDRISLRRLRVSLFSKYPFLFESNLANIFITRSFTWSILLCGLLLFGL
jgi:hypothetical protein